jgi:hypothetical protein
VPGPIMIMGIFGLVGKRKVDLRTCIGTRYRPSPPRYLSRGPPIQYVGERASAVCLLDRNCRGGFHFCLGREAEKVIC